MQQLSFFRTAVTLLSIVVLFIAQMGCQSSPQQQEDTTPVQQQEDAAEVQQQRPDNFEPEQPVGPDDEELAARFSDDDLEMFARGVRAVAEREAQLEAEGRDLETLTDEASHPLEVREAQEQVLEEMEDALAEENLRFDDFMRMGQVIRQSPTLLERLGEHLDEEEIESFFSAD